MSGLRLWTDRLRLWTTAHPWFGAVLALGLALRVVTMLGYRPALWFPDTYTYVVTVYHPRPDLVRPAGYSAFLMLLEPLHSFAVVASVQHLLGMAVGVMVYVTALRLRAPKWAAVLATVPVLLDAYQVQMEHLLVSDTLFAFLVTAAVCLAAGRRVTWRTACAAGLLVAAATLTRTVGLPLVAVLAGWLLVRPGSGARRARLLRAGTMLAAAVVPILAYGGWFHATHQRAGLVGANGVFLYSRAMSFADCSVMRPPPDLAVLCDQRPPSRRPPSQNYIWDAASPLVKLPGITFSAANDALAGRFASLAIRSQPLDYAGSVLSELGRTFTWGRPVYPDQATYDYYEFPSVTPPPPTREPARAGAEDAERYVLHQGITPRIVEPFAGWMRAYQGVARLPGAVLLAVLLVPPAAVAARRLRHGTWAGSWTDAAPWLLPWVTAWVLLAAPPAVAQFDYRYVLPVVPLVTLAAAAALGTPASRHPGKSVNNP